MISKHCKTLWWQGVIRKGLLHNYLYFKKTYLQYLLLLIKSWYAYMIIFLMQRKHWATHGPSLLTKWIISQIGFLYHSTVFIHLLAVSPFTVLFQPPCIIVTYHQYQIVIRAWSTNHHWCWMLHKIWPSFEAERDNTIRTTSFEVNELCDLSKFLHSPETQFFYFNNGDNSRNCERVCIYGN